MRRRTFASGLIASSLGASFSRVARAQTPAATIQVAAAPAEDLTDLYYAIKTGAFARAGLDVSMVAMRNGSTSTTAVITGAVAIARASLLATISAHVRGIPIVIVAPSIVASAKHPQALLQIAADSPYKTGADLNGKTIAVGALNDINALSTIAWVDKTGGDWRSLKFVEIPNVALEAALVAHRVDATIIQSPELDASIAAGTTKTLAYSHGAIAPVFMNSGYLARIDWTAQHVDELHAFGRVLEQANVYVAAHPAETLPLVAELTKIQISSNEKMFRTLNGTTLDPALVQPLIDAAAKYGFIPHAFPAQELLWGAYATT